MLINQYLNKTQTLLLFYICVLNNGIRSDNADGKQHCYKTNATQSEENCSRLSLDDGQIAYSGTGVGEIATFSCQENYTLCGHDVVQCNINGKWDRGLPVCITDYLNVTVTYEGSSYFFSNDPNNYKNFNNSQEFCENQGGYLLAINSEEELEFINCVIDKVIVDSYTFIGLINQNGTWMWTSGQTISVTNYYSTDLANSRYCGILAMRQDDYKWVAIDILECGGYEFGFICEIPL